MRQSTRPHHSNTSGCTAHCWVCRTTHLPLKSHSRRRRNTTPRLYCLLWLGTTGTWASTPKSFGEMTLSSRSRCQQPSSQQCHHSCTVQHQQSYWLLGNTEHHSRRSCPMGNCSQCQDKCQTMQTWLTHRMTTAQRRLWTSWLGSKSVSCTLRNHCTRITSNNHE